MLQCLVSNLFFRAAIAIWIVNMQINNAILMLDHSFCDDLCAIWFEVHKKRFGIASEIHHEITMLCKLRKKLMQTAKIIDIKWNFAKIFIWRKRKAAKCKSQSSYVLNASYRRKSSFIGGEIPPIASSLPSANRSNIFITMLRKEKSNRNTFY
jgi:hypothetical protein